MFKKFVSAWIVAILAFVSMVIWVQPARGATWRTIVVAYEEQGYNIPCLRPPALGGCKSWELQWNSGGCATAASSGYVWKASNTYAPEFYSITTALHMSSVKLVPGSGCNYLRVKGGEGQLYGQCVVSTAGGIRWFGPGYNDSTWEVGAFYVPACGRHL